MRVAQSATVAHSAMADSATPLTHGASPLRTRGGEQTRPSRGVSRQGEPTQSSATTACGRVVKSTTPLSFQQPVVESTTPPKPHASPFEGLATKVASACRHGSPLVYLKVKIKDNHRANLGSTFRKTVHGNTFPCAKQATHAALPVAGSADISAVQQAAHVPNLYSLYRTCTPVQILYCVAKTDSVPVTESVTVTKAGTVTDSVTPSVTDRATDGARAKAALCDCNPITRAVDASVDADVDGPVDAGVVGLRTQSQPLYFGSLILQGSLKDPSGSAQGMLEQCSGHPTSIHDRQIVDHVDQATRSSPMTASPKVAPSRRHGERQGAPKYPFGEAFGEGFGEPFRDALISLRYQADITPLTVKPPLRNRIGTLPERVRNGSVTVLERCGNALVTVD